MLVITALCLQAAIRNSKNDPDAGLKLLKDMPAPYELRLSFKDGAEAAAKVVSQINADLSQFALLTPCEQHSAMKELLTGLEGWREGQQQMRPGENFYSVPTHFEWDCGKLDWLAISKGRAPKVFQQYVYRYVQRSPNGQGLALVPGVKPTWQGSDIPGWEAGLAFDEGISSEAAKWVNNGYYDPGLRRPHDHL